jgi:beta-alanine--pyruvate transaminase
LLTRASELAPYWEEAVHSLRGLPHVIDVRNIGLIGAVEFEPIEGEPGKRAYDRFLEALRLGALVRATGDVIALAPPLIISNSEIDELIGIFARALTSVRD